MTRKNKLSALTILVLKLGGQNITDDSKLSVIVTIITVFTLGSVLILGLIEPFMREISIDSILESYELSGPYLQVLTGILVLQFNMKLIRKIVNEMDEKFWPSDRFGEELKRKQEKIINLCYYFPVILLSGFVSSVFFIVLKSFFAEKRITPFKCYEIWSYEEHGFYYAVIYGFQFYNMYSGCVVVTGYDSLFVDSISRIICQMMMVSEGIRKLRLDEITTNEEEADCYEKIKEYINHHSILLRMLNDIKKIYSFILLYKILGIIISLCVGLYTILMVQYNLIYLFRAGCLILAFLFQLTAYCISGSVIEDECIKLGTSVFYGGWHGNCGKRLKNALYMMIMRSQKPQILSAEGMISADLQGYGKILQFTISFYTLLSNTKQK